MTSGARPNLGGLFNGSTPPEKLNGSAVRPKLILSTPLVAQGESASSDRPAAAPSEPKTPSPEQPGPAQRGSGLQWLDPVKAVEQYFVFLQTLLEANRRLAVALTTTAVSLPGRLGMRP